eukprot:TRINITY_DN9602_c5_g1_i1.p1 TRINITY_DN9602_c5_g1~~TRINITY_DN9602_c5_g1_i1.p1  ORF type:complete len:558 (+),score=156.38 TRINITY_DN9602_c5_g1_i1:39-1712(+)
MEESDPLPANEPKNVYEQWKDFDFEGCLSKFQDRYELVVSNISNAVEEKSELVAFVKDFTTKVNKQDSCERKDIEKVLAFFKAFFARLLERANLAEECFQELYCKFGQLPNPTPILLNAMMVLNENSKLETQLRAAEQLQSSSEESQAKTQEQQKQIESLRENLDKSAVTTRELETAIETKNREISQTSTQLQQLRESMSVLESRNSDLSNHVSSLQASHQQEIDLSLEENTRLTDKVNELLSELESFKQQQPSSESSSTKQTAALEAKLSASSLQIEQLEMNLKSIMTDNNSLETVVDSKNEEIKQLKQNQQRLEGSDTRSLRAIKDMGIETSVIDEGGDVIQVVLTLNKKYKDTQHQLRDCNDELTRTKLSIEEYTTSMNNLTRSLSDKEDQINSLLQQLQLGSQGGGGGGGSGGGQSTPQFDLSELVAPKEVNNDTIVLLTNQREQLKEKVATLQRQRTAAVHELDSLKRTLKLQNANNDLISCVTSSPKAIVSSNSSFRTSWDSFAFQIIKNINGNVYTRLFMVCYVGFLHLLVFSICYYLTHDYKSNGRNSY